MLLQKRYGNGCCCRFPLQFPYPRTVPSCSTPDNESSKELSDELCLFFCAGSFYHGSTDFSIEIEKFSEYLIVSPCVPPTAFLTEPFLTAEDFGIFLNTESCPVTIRKAKRAVKKLAQSFLHRRQRPQSAPEFRQNQRKTRPRSQQRCRDPTGILKGL